MLYSFYLILSFFQLFKVSIASNPIEIQSTENLYSFDPTFPPCASNVFTERGDINLQPMFYNCSNRIPTALSPPSLYNNGTPGVFEPTKVTIQIGLNNLVSVNDISNSITLDLYLRMYWNDPRVYMPEIWDNLNPMAQLDGIDITAYIRNENELNFWLPDVQFLQCIESNLVSEMIKLLPNGTLYWSQHLIATFSQPDMNYEDFPLDSQTFSLELQSYAFGTSFLYVSFTNDQAVTLSLDYQSGTPTITQNALWYYKSYSAIIKTISSPTVTNPNRAFSIALINLYFERQSDGVVFRLAFPVMLFLIIVGFSFWAELDKRIDVTLQILLVTSALYLIIGQSIPFVGYLTVMDEFITIVFVFLAIIVGIHFFTIILSRKQDKYPMNEFYKESLVLFFRVSWIPMSITLFIAFFKQTNPQFICLLVFFIIFCISYIFKRNNHIHATYNKCIEKLKQKAKAANKGLIDESDGLVIQLGLGEILMLSFYEKFLESIPPLSASATSSLNEKRISEFGNSIELKSLSC